MNTAATAQVGSSMNCAQVGVAERLGRGGRRRDPRRHHRERDHEGQEVDAERLVRVERGAGRPRVLADQLEVAERGDERDDERQQERHPQRAADHAGHRPGQRVDAGAEDVADHEEQQQLRPDRPLQLRLSGDRARSVRCVDMPMPAKGCRVCSRFGTCPSHVHGRCGSAPGSARTRGTRATTAIAHDDHGDPARPSRRRRGRTRPRPGRATDRRSGARPTTTTMNTPCIRPRISSVATVCSIEERYTELTRSPAPGDGEEQHRQPQRAVSPNERDAEPPRRRSATVTATPCRLTRCSQPENSPATTIADRDRGEQQPERGAAAERVAEHRSAPSRGTPPAASRSPSPRRR